MTSRLRCLIVSLVLVAIGLPAQATNEPPRSIRVVLDNAYAPYSFVSDDGDVQGILVDQWRAWEKKTGIKVEISALNWVDGLQRIRAGEFDVIDSIVETAERREYFDFTPSYATVETSIIFRDDISGIADLASLKGFPVGVKAGDQHVDQLKAHGVTTVIPFKKDDEIIEAAKEHKINVFVVDAPSAHYLLNKMGIEADFRQSAPIFRDELRRAVRKGNANLLRTVLAGFAAVDPRELAQIDEKWFGRTIGGNRQYLTYAGYATMAAMLLAASLAGWNRSLRKGILQRTVELDESQQRFGRLVDLMPVAVYVCDTSGVLQSYNSRAVELWGRAPKVGDQEQRFCGSFRLYTPEGEVIPHESSAMAAVLRTGIPARDLEVVIERPDLSRVTVLVNAAPLTDPSGEVIGAMNCFQDITERKRVENALRDSGIQLQALSRRLVELQEYERKELARELHDRVGQNLTALRINLEILQPALAAQGNDDSRTRVADSEALLEATMGIIEDVMSELRPPMLDTHGLAGALQWHARKFSKRTGIAVAVHVSEAATRPEPQVEIALFRIAQEALNNVAKHARARFVDISLEHVNGECVMSVRDDGIGFDGVWDTSGKTKAGLGIVTMRERSEAVGGHFEVQALPGRGTQLTVRVPN